MSKYKTAESRHRHWRRQVEDEQWTRERNQRKSWVELAAKTVLVGGVFAVVEFFVILLRG